MKNRLLGQAFRNGYHSLVRHPKWRWWVVLGSLLYLVSPIDIFPDVLPLVGWVDDGLIATLAVTEISQLLLENRRNLARKTGSGVSQKVAVNDAEGVIDVPSVTVG